MKLGIVGLPNVGKSTDTIVGKNGKGDILTLVERIMFFCMMQKLPKGKNAKV